MKTNREYINATIEELQNNPEWESIYDRYANELTINSKRYSEKAKLFQVNRPIVVYSSLGNVKTNSKTATFDLRFAGQSIGRIEVDKDNEVKLFVSESQAEYAKENFEFTDSQTLKGVLWKESKEAKRFRQFYYNLESTSSVKIKSKEHRIESMLLKEFSKTSRKEKLLCNIQPIRLGGKFFQLKTPLKASTHNPNISLTKNKNGATGGGVDILARVKHSHVDYRIAIIELKDENKEAESQEAAMFQAMTYATFIAKLLRSKSGVKWYNIFRPSKKDKPLKDNIDIDVVTLMPMDGKSHEGELDTIHIASLDVTLHPYTLYYRSDKDGNPSSFEGTLTDALLK